MTPGRGSALPRWAVLTVLLAVLLTACSGGDDGRFEVGGGTEISCMEHQSASPGTAYTGGVDGDTAAILAVLRYYVANGAKGYCDGEPPNDEDLQWARLVVDLGGSKQSVDPILDAAG